MCLVGDGFHGHLGRRARGGSAEILQQTPQLELGKDGAKRLGVRLAGTRLLPVELEGDVLTQARQLARQA